MIIILVHQLSRIQTEKTTRWIIVRIVNHHEQCWSFVWLLFEEKPKLHCANNNTDYKHAVVNWLNSLLAPNFIIVRTLELITAKQ